LSEYNLDRRGSYEHQPPPSKQTIETVLEQLSKEDLLSLIKQMVQQHPDLTELIATRQPTAPEKQQHIPFKPEVYRRQVAEILLPLIRTKWGSEGRAADPLWRLWILVIPY